MQRDLDRGAFCHRSVRETECLLAFRLIHIFLPLRLTFGKFCYTPYSVLPSYAYIKESLCFAKPLGEAFTLSVFPVKKMAEAMAVLGSVAAALQLVVQVKKAIDKVRQAPEIVKFIIQDLEVFESTLQFLKGTLKTMQSVADNTDKQKGKQRASLDWADQVQILRSIEPILKHCQTTCRNIQSTVAPFVQKARDTGRRKWIHAWTWTTSESKLKDLKWDLFSYKQSLHIGISLLAIHQSDSNTAQVLQQVHRLRQDLESADRRNYAGALADGTKPRVAMERFLSDTQTVVDAVNDPPPVYSSEGDMQSEVSGESENSDSESEAEYGQRATSEPSGWSPQYTPAAFEGKRITKSLLSDIFQRPVNIFIGGHQQQQSALSYGIIVHVTAGGLSKYNSTVQDEVDGASYKRNYVWWFVKKVNNHVFYT